MYLGVPGIFHEEEAKAAGVFGFPQFIPLTETDLELPEEECEGESFGYWCRQIRNPYRCQERKKWSRFMVNTDEKYMKEAINQPKTAYAIGEVPIGCVIVYEDKIIGRGYNRRTIDKNTLAHAELQAIRKASKKMDDWRLEGCTMYVTLEPCQMCSGAIVQSRMDRVVVGCMNPKAGCAGSILNLLNVPEFNHQVELTTGVLGEECSQMMKAFFKELREKKKKTIRHTAE